VIFRLGSAAGAADIEEHPFFEGFDFLALLRKEIDAPMKSHALTESELDVSAHSKVFLFFFILFLILQDELNPQHSILYPIPYTLFPQP
jgi:hypothetical protein